MKKLLYYSSIFLLITCEKQDFEVVDIFDFTIATSVLEEKNYVNETSTIVLKILPKKSIATAKYTFHYALNKGSALLFYDHKKIATEQTILTGNTSIDLELIPANLDLIEITITVQHAEDDKLIHTEVVKLKPVYKEFSLELFAQEDEFPLNQYSPVNLRISSAVGTEDDLYNFSYQVENGYGYFYLQNKENNYTPLDYEKSHYFTKGLHKIYYKPGNVAAGKHTLNIKIEGPDGHLKEEVLELKITNLHWQFEASVETTSPKKNQKYDLVINVDQQGLGIENFIRFEAAGGTLKVFNPEGKQVDLGLWNRIEEETFIFSFISSEEAESTIIVTMKDQNDHQTEKVIQISTTKIPFSIEGFPERNEVILNTDILINIAVSSEFKTDKLEYSYGLLQGNGTLKDASGVVLLPANKIDAKIGTTSFLYKPKNIGQHKIKFTAYLDGQLHSVEVDLSVVFSDFVFSAESAVTKTFVKDTLKQNFNISQQEKV